MFNNILENLRFYLSDEYNTFSVEQEKVEMQEIFDDSLLLSSDVGLQFYFSNNSSIAKVLFLRFVSNTSDCPLNSKNIFANKKAEELLNSAITKGMCLADNDYTICTVSLPNWNDAKAKDAAINSAFTFEDVITGNNIKTLITLGDENSVLLCDGLSNKSILEIHGNINKYMSIKFGHEILTMPTFSPEYILQNPAAKRLFWEDLKLMLNRY